VDISVDAASRGQAAAGGREQGQGMDKQELTYATVRLRELSREDPKMAAEFAQSSDLLELTTRSRDFSQDVRYEKDLGVVVDPVRRDLRVYEMFPRSCTMDPKRPGTFRDCAARLAVRCVDGF